MLMARSPSQKDPFIVIDECERPPIVAYGGRSPSKSPAERIRASKEYAKVASPAGPYMHITSTSPKASVGGGNVTPRNRQQ